MNELDKSDLKVFAGVVAVSVLIVGVGAISWKVWDKSKPEPTPELPPAPLRWGQVSLPIMSGTNIIALPFELAIDGSNNVHWRVPQQ